MKNVSPIIILLVVFVGYIGLSAWSDYSWENRYLAERNRGWIVLKKIENNVLDPLHLYAIVKPPITSIALIDSTVTKQISPGIYYVRKLWANKELGGGVTEEDFKYLMDCNKKMEGWKKGKNGSESLEPNEVNSVDVEWSSFYENEKKYPGSGAANDDECKVLKSSVI